MSNSNRSHFQWYLKRVNFVATTYDLPLGKAAVNTLAANYPTIHARMFKNELELVAGGNGELVKQFLLNVAYLMREYEDTLQ